MTERQTDRTDQRDLLDELPELGSLLAGKEAVLLTEEGGVVGGAGDGDGAEEEREGELAELARDEQDVRRPSEGEVVRRRGVRFAAREDVLEDEEEKLVGEICAGVLSG